MGGLAGGESGARELEIDLRHGKMLDLDKSQNLSD